MDAAVASHRHIRRRTKNVAEGVSCVLVFRFGSGQSSVTDKTDWFGRKRITNAFYGLYTRWTFHRNPKDLEIWPDRNRSSCVN